MLIKKSLIKMVIKIHGLICKNCENETESESMSNNMISVCLELFIIYFVFELISHQVKITSQECIAVFIYLLKVNLGNTIDFALVSLLVTLNRFHKLFWCFYF